jgi:hypothetical protein
MANVSVSAGVVCGSNNAVSLAYQLNVSIQCVKLFYQLSIWRNG